MLPPILTSCKDCCFATYVDNTQVGCQVSMIDRFKAVNTVVDAYDKDKEFFVILNHQCMLKRSHVWKDENVSSQMFCHVLYDTPFPYHVVILGDDSATDIVDTINNMEGQTLLPAKISVIRPFGSTSNITTVRVALADVAFKSGIKWRLENILNPDINLPTTMQQLVLNNNKIPYVVFIDAGILLSKTTLAEIREKIYIDLLQFSAIEYHGVTIMPFNIWKYFKLTSNPQHSIVDNIRQSNIAEEKDEYTNIHQLTKLVPQCLLNQKQLSYTPVLS